MGEADAKPTDEQLVARVRGGDESAARELFDRHVDSLRARVRRRLPATLRRRVGESDVIQDAYLTAFLKMADFQDRGEGSFSKWIGAILKNKLSDEVRKQLGTEMRRAVQEVSVAGPAGAPEPADAGPSPSLAEIGRESRDAMRAVIDALPPDYAAILRLVHGQRLPLKEAAQLLGRSDEATRKLYARALRAFTDRARRPSAS